MRSCKVSGCTRIPYEKRKVCTMHIQRYKKYKSYEEPLKQERKLKICRVHGQLNFEQINFNQYSQRCRLCASDYFRIEIPKNIISRQCTSCKQTKEKTEFQPSHWNDRIPQCRECKKVTVNKRREKAHCAGNPYATTAVRNQVKKYGITLKDYLKMVLLQNELCAICKKPETSKIREMTRRLVVDHCHLAEKDGRLKIRALLCSACNTGLGSFRDNIENLRAAAEYLEYYRDK